MTKPTAERLSARRRTRLAVYLGVSNSHRFPPRHAVGHRAEGIRVKLLVTAVALLALCLWGLWHEFF